MDESELISRLKSGNKEAFDELVSLYRRTVLNICYRFLLNREDAEDVSQEVFIEVFHSIKKFRGEAKLSTWIYRIATTKSLAEIKRKKRKKRISSVGRTIGIDRITNWIEGTERPDKTMEEIERFSALMKALDKLPENQRVALTLSKIESYTNSEIAEIMETTLIAVDSLIYRAKQNIKSYLIE